MEDEEKQKQQPVIIVKKKGGHGGHHGGAWKVAYADFMTALMALFLVMWLVSQNDDVKQAVQGYFNNPINFMKGTGAGIIKGGKSPLKTQPNNKRAEGASSIESAEDALTQASVKIREALDHMPEIGKLKDFIQIELIPEGLRIELAEVSTNPDSINFFTRGSAELRPTTRLILNAISQELKLLPNKIVIEGHTDNMPYSGRTNYTNWELSADRANSARRHMVASGLPETQMVEIRGYADRHLKLPKKPQDPRNRRIAIIVLHEELEQRYRFAEIEE